MLPNGTPAVSHTPNINAREMLAWSRWQLGWLDESQVRCIGVVTDDGDTHTVQIIKTGG